MFRKTHKGLQLISQLFMIEYSEFKKEYKEILYSLQDHALPDKNYSKMNNSCLRHEQYLLKNSNLCLAHLLHYSMAK